MRLNDDNLGTRLGSGFLRKRSLPVARVGTLVLYRADLARIGVVETTACAKLARATHAFRGRSLPWIYRHTSPLTFTDKGVGETTVFVLMKLFDAQGLNATAWYDKSRKGKVVTFATIKRGHRS